MHKIEEATLTEALKPFDVVSIESGAVGYIRQVSVNDCQPDAKHQISYAITWLIGCDKTAWWKKEQLEYHCNFFIKIAKDTCNNSSGDESYVPRLFNLPPSN